MRPVRVLEGAIATLMVALVVVVFAQVALRYLTYQPLAWTEEVARYVFIWVSMLGAALGGRRGAHFAVDVLPRALPPAGQRMLGGLLRLGEAAFYGLLAWAGVRIVQVAHLQRSASIDIPMSLPYAAIPLAAGLLCLESVARAMAAWRRPA